jgi:hypothetical protein
MSDYGLLSEENVRSRPVQEPGRHDDFYADRPTSENNRGASMSSARGGRLGGQLGEPAGGAAPSPPARRGFWGRVGRSIGGAFGAIGNAVGSGLRRLFGGGGRRAQEQPRPDPRPPAFDDYAEANLGNVFQGDRYALPPRRRGIPAEMGVLGRAANAATREGRADPANGQVGPGGNGTSLVEEAEREAAAAFDMQPKAIALQRAMAMQRAMPPRGPDGVRERQQNLGSGSHESSESVLGARFDEMEDEGEDLIPRDPAAQDQPQAPEQSRESFLREQERRLAGLPVVPSDMLDHPWGETLYQPQRRRVHL